MAMVAASMLYPAIPSSNGSIIRLTLCSSNHFAVNVKDFASIKCRSFPSQLTRGSSLKGNTRQADEEAEEPGLEFMGSIEDNQNEMRNLSRSETDSLHVSGQNDSNFIDASNVDNMGDKQSEDNESDDELISGETAMKGSIIAGLLLVGVVGGFGATSYIYKDQINDFLLKFSDFIEGYGAAGYAIFVAGYAGLEILAIPAIPLTMSAGLLFGTVVGTILVSISGTIAATAAFLIARYVARDRILKLAQGNKKFLAIDKAIGENGFRVVALLRLSPLLPLSLSNYLYGLTSVELFPYILGSWLGMLPGTWAYVSAGAVGRALIQQEAEGNLGGGSEHLLTLAAGLLVTVIAATYVTRLAKDAVKDID